MRIALCALVVATLLPGVVLAGEPTDPPPPPDPRVKAALLAAFRSPVVIETDPERRAAQQRREREMMATLRPVEAVIQLSLPDRGKPTGLRVRAVHPQFDLTTKTVDVDAWGRAILELPPGTWTVFVSGEMPADTVAFGRATVHVPVPAPDALPSEHTIELAPVTQLRFRGPGNGAARPERVDLATPALDHRLTWRGDTSALHVLAPNDEPFVVQMSQTPDGRPGYVIRETVTPDGEPVVLTARGDGTTLRFPATPQNQIEPEIDSMDALSAPMTFRAKDSTRVVVRGLAEMAIGYRAHRDGKTLRFYTAPLAMTGEERSFDGDATHDVSVGSYWATSSRHKQHRYKVSIRVFFRDSNGLILVGSSKKAPIPVAWRAFLDGQEWARGEMTARWAARLPVVREKERFEALEFELSYTDDGATRTVLVPSQPFRLVAEEGRARVKAMPQLALNAKAWARRVNELADAFAEVQHRRPSTLTYVVWVHAMPGLSGWGGWNGNRAWGHFGDTRLFGFARPPKKNDGTLSHEMTHGHRIYSHGTTFQNTQNRAVRRWGATRSGGHRVPGGQKHLAAIERLRPGRPELPADGVPVGAAGRVDPLVGEDELIAWYVRSRFGVKVGRDARYHFEFNRWWLTLRGFTDDEARAGVLQHFTGENLAWLIRARGGAVTDARSDEAAYVASNPEKVKRPVAKIRSAAVNRWKDPDLSKEEDLDAALAKMDAELGHWSSRSKVYLRAAREMLERHDAQAARAHVLRAMECGARLGREWFERALDEGAKLLSDAQ